MAEGHKLQLRKQIRANQIRTKRLKQLESDLEAQVVRDRFLYPVVERVFHSRHPVVVWYVRIYECYLFCKRLKERVELILGFVLLAAR